MKFLNKLILKSIKFYQRKISPNKGFSCNYTKIGQMSCSNYGYKVFSRFNVIVAYKLLKRRLKKCKELG